MLPTQPSPLRAPAIALLVASLACAATLTVALGFDMLLFATGLVDELADPAPMDKRTQVLVRMAWAAAMLATNAFIAWGAVQMMRLRNYGGARAAAIASLVPCIGPCFVLGIPFGLWALSVMKRPDVHASFE